MLLESRVEKRDGFCLDLDLLGLNIALAVFNGVLAAIAFSQVCNEYPLLFSLYCKYFSALLNISLSGLVNFEGVS